MPNTSPEIREFRFAVTRHLTHTDMGIVLPVLDHHLKHLLGLKAEYEVPAGRMSGVCLRVTSGEDKAKAEAVFAEMARQIVALDPYKLTDMNEARVMLGLPELHDPFSAGFVARVMDAISTENARFREGQDL